MLEQAILIPGFWGNHPTSNIPGFAGATLMTGKAQSNDSATKLYKVTLIGSKMVVS
jgi:hypothetical protein